MNENRLIAVLQVFTIILVFKSISATYYATKYSMENQLGLVSHYANTLSIIPIFLLISLVLIALPLIFKIKENVKKGLDIISLIIIVIGLIILFL